jgi:hypothetical protein
MARGPLSLTHAACRYRGALFALLLQALSHHADADPIVYTVAPSDTDPKIHRYLNDNWVIFNPPARPAADLFLFLRGSAPTEEGGQSAPGALTFLSAAANAGYRVIALSYDDHPAVLQVCLRNPDPACSGKFREKRIFGNNVTEVIDDTPAESIVNRLVKLLELLARQHPNEGWEAYLANGAPLWSRIAVAGHSQGAGMAAYIAKRIAVARVVLSSGPEDQSMGTLAPWISAPSATPPERWLALYHARDQFAPILQRAFPALRIPPTQVRMLNLEPMRLNGPNPYHVSVVGDGSTPRGPNGMPLYLADWNFVIGRSP